MDCNLTILARLAKVLSLAAKVPLTLQHWRYGENTVHFFLFRFTAGFAGELR